MFATIMFSWGSPASRSGENSLSFAACVGSFPGGDVGAELADVAALAPKSNLPSMIIIRDSVSETITFRVSKLLGPIKCTRFILF